MSLASHSVYLRCIVFRTTVDRAPLVETLAVLLLLKLPQGLVHSKAVDECFETAARVFEKRHAVTDDNRIEVEFEQRSNALA